VLAHLKSLASRVLRFFVNENLESFGPGPHRFTTDRQIQDVLKELREITNGRPSEGKDEPAKGSGDCR
jgi:hypothetical protein